MVATPIFVGAAEAEEQPEAVTYAVVGDLGFEGTQVARGELEAAAESAARSLEVVREGETAQSDQITAMASDPRWALVNSWRDKTGMTIYLRYGDGIGWGWNHIKTKHGVIQRQIQAATTRYFSRASTSLTNYRFRATIRLWECGLSCSVKDEEILRVIYDTKNNKGVITSYCEGRIVCPKWTWDAI